MKPWNGEGMEGAAHVGASARVIEFPSQALALRGERVPAAPAAGDPDSPEAAAKTIHEIARSNVMRSLITIVLFSAASTRSTRTTPRSPTTWPAFRSWAP